MRLRHAAGFLEKGKLGPNRRTWLAISVFWGCRAAITANHMHRVRSSFQPKQQLSHISWIRFTRVCVRLMSKCNALLPHTHTKKRNWKESARTHIQTCGRQFYGLWLDQDIDDDKPELSETLRMKNGSSSWMLLRWVQVIWLMFGPWLCRAIAYMGFFFFSSKTEFDIFEAQILGAENSFGVSG